MDIPKEKLLNIFVTESSDIILQLEDDVLELENDPQNPELINSIFRSFHTVKGNAGMLGLSELKDFTHQIENLFLRIRKKEIEADEDIITIILDSIDILKDFIHNINETDSLDENETKKVLKLIDKYHKNDADSKQEKPSKAEKQISSKDGLHRYHLSLEFNKDIFFKHGIDPGIFVRDFLTECEEYYIRIDMSELPDINKIDPHSFYFKWEILAVSKKNKREIDDLFIFVLDDNKILIKEIDGEEYKEREKYFKAKHSKSHVSHKEQERKTEDFFQKEGYIIQNEEEGYEETEEDLPQSLTQSNEKTTPDTTKTKDTSSKKRDFTPRRGNADLLKVKTEKVDKLMNLISELVISQARAARLGGLILQSLSKIEMESYKYKGFNLKEIVDYEIFSQFEQSINTLDRISREMQNGVLEIRMVPIGPTFNQFRRLIRDYSKEVEKDIDLYIKGEDTELDKNMIKSINDPLVHLIRNAIDHGLETREERKKKGKPPVGKLTLEAYQSEGKVVISISDDGKGLDKDRIYNKAIKVGILDLEQEITEEEIYQLIFAPGLSTAKKITDISGRGVGMDVVKNNVEKLKGKIEIITEKTKGTTFKILLPLTLAIIDGMIVKVFDRTYIIPVLSIVSSYRPQESDIKTVEGGKDEIIKFRDTYIPLVRLNDIFGFDYKAPPLNESLVIAIEVDGHIVGILVDELIGKQQTVMKGLEENFENVKGISAATILGDGNVALILDVDSIVKISQERSKQKKQMRFIV